MAILIVDDETSTRDALREILVQLGHKVVLEAKNGEEALKTLESEKSRIEMIIADWEMPYMDGLTLSDRLSEKTAHDLIPFLLITSDLPKSKLTELRKQHPRMDHSLLKPFRMSLLSQAMKDAFAQRARSRDTLLWLGSSAVPEALKSSLTEKSNSSIFKKVVTDPSATHLGALLIDPTSSGLDLAWLATFKKSVFGSSLPWICLSRDPQKIFPLRTYCHLFVENSGKFSQTDWMEFFLKIQNRVLNAFEIELFAQETKTSVQSKDFASALKTLKKLLSIDAESSETHAWMGDISHQLQDFNLAAQSYERSIELNPCLPKPYIKLFEILTSRQRDSIEKIATSAENYCPQNTDVLNAAARALYQSGDSTRAKTIADSILKLNPSHAGAKELLSRYPGSS